MHIICIESFKSIKLSVDLCKPNKDYMDTKPHAVCACCCSRIFPHIRHLSATKWLEKYLEGFYSFSSKVIFFLACYIAEH